VKDIVKTHKKEMRRLAMEHVDGMSTLDNLTILNAVQDIHTDTKKSLDVLFSLVRSARADTVDLCLPVVKSD
tara:strand:- start:2031 stop:2246 length:216 start_codon:yes stop_codon:yes gene_type:complete